MRTVSIILISCLTLLSSTVRAKDIPPQKAKKKLQHSSITFAKKYKRTTAKLVNYAARKERRFNKRDSVKNIPFNQLNQHFKQQNDSIGKLTFNTSNKREIKYQRALMVTGLCDETNRAYNGLLYGIKKDSTGGKRHLKFKADLDKKTFYTRIKNRYAKQEMANALKKYDPGILKAKKEAMELNVNYRTGLTDKIPDKLQSKKNVLKSLPQNKPGAGTDTKSTLNQNMQNSLKTFESKRNSAIDLEHLNDTAAFNINPYRGIPFKQKWVVGTNWEFRKASFAPAVLELAITNGYKVNKRTTPFIAMSYILGMGYHISDIRFTHEGFGLRAGADYLVRGNAGIFLSNELTLAKLHKEGGETAYQSGYQYLLGVFVKSGGSKKGMKISAGYNLRHLFDPYHQRAFTIRVGIE